MLQISKLYKVFYFGEINEKIALQNINLGLAPGEFVTVIGGNGAGKSTLLNCIAGVYTPEEGTIALDGRSITNLPDYRRAASICRIFQDPLTGTAASLTVEENLALALLMATLVRPKLALLDEHTASLDPKTALRVLHLTRTLFEKERITTLMITHNMEQALRLGNRLIMLHEGSIILDVNDGERNDLSVSRLVEMFHNASGEQLQNDRLLLS